jgi:hypothetical protein
MSALGAGGGGLGVDRGRSWKQCEEDRQREGERERTGKGVWEPAEEQLNLRKGVECLTAAGIDGPRPKGEHRLGSWTKDRADTNNCSVRSSLYIALSNC